ncbi:SpoIIE family protein phosphatase [Magnetospirillum aberrantis SpK]|uniref:SpoIIE family protein phosphatase n=2 Tax=Magnetospirillum TaxID=13134 RepID=A0A7C9QWE5_9PROT|nr:SpoIIE family protein phosphatase [Magnetospirillum aberrantis SpK]
MSGNAKMRMLDGLSFKQAFATLAIALVLGLLSSAYELLSDYRAMHDQVRRAYAANLQLVRGLAVEAAYQLSAELAGEVARGLHEDPAVIEVTLTDNYGGRLGGADRPLVATPLPSLARDLFGDIADYSLTLETRAPDGSMSVVGRLDLKLDTGRLLNTWLDRVLQTMWSGAARAILLCVFVVAVFYAMITKPLLKITAAIAKVDPARPGAFLIELPPKHDRDELGVLVGTMNSMLVESQDGLDGRDKAEAELAALARDLERRVEERTHELAREKEGVERALAQLNVANAELEKANRFINDGIRYASRIQTALLPDQGALVGLVDELAVGWQPLDIVGGDYYWAGAFGNKGVIAVMDCTGHGVPGAFMTAVVASSFSRILHHHGHDDPAEMLTQLNRLVKTALRQDRDSAVSNDGLDAGICVLDRDRGTITFAGANLPLLVAEDGAFHLLRGDRMSLGYLDSPEDYRFTAREMPFRKGNAFYLFTDGVTDQVGSEVRQLFGRKRLQQVLTEVADRPLNEQMDVLFQRLAQWRGDERRRDDMTFLAFRPQV